MAMMRADDRRLGVEADRVRQWLFVVPQNGSGSTFLTACLHTCRRVIALPAEGQHVRGFRGPSPRLFDEQFAWARRGCRVAGALATDLLYDWPATRRAWLAVARPSSPVADVLVEKSPPNMVRVDLLDRHFPGARFLFLVRDPFALAESVIRHRPDLPDAEGAAVEHIVACLERQRANADRHVPSGAGLLLRYEDLCDEPGAAEARLQAWLPELGDICVRRHVRVRDDELPLTNLNAEHHARLGRAATTRLAAAFGPHEELLAWFGYPTVLPASPRRSTRGP
jgi:hypothetical protein